MREKEGLGGLTFLVLSGFCVFCGGCGFMVELKICRCECGEYEIEASSSVLGTMYEDGVESIRVVKPEDEIGSACRMLVTANGKLVDNIVVGDEPVVVTSNMSQYNPVRIGFSFERADGTVKNVVGKQFYFFFGEKPDQFVPVAPEQKEEIDKVVQGGFTDIVWKEGGHNTLQFLNSSGKVIKEIELSGFVQEQADLAEVDETKESFVRGKKTSNLENDGDGVSSFATEEFVQGEIQSAIVDSWGSEY